MNVRPVLQVLQAISQGMRRRLFPGLWLFAPVNGERAPEHPDEVGDVPVRGVQREVRVPFIQRGAFPVQVLQGLSGRARNAPVIEVPEPRGNVVAGQIQIDQGSDGPEVFHAAGTVDRAAAGGNHAPRGADGQQRRLLDLPEALLPLRSEDLRQYAPLPLLDDEVRVHEAVAQHFGEDHACRALSAAGHSDQDEVVPPAPVFDSVSHGRPSFPGFVLSRSLLFRRKRYKTGAFFCSSLDFYDYRSRLRICQSLYINNNASSMKMIFYDMQEICH